MLRVPDFLDSGRLSLCCVAVAHEKGSFTRRLFGVGVVRFQVLKAPEYKQLVQSLSGPRTVHILCDQ